MKLIQETLKYIVPVYQDAYRPTGKNQAQPEQYIVYTTMTTEGWHTDDAYQSLKTYVYMNLWSKNDPTNTAKAVRTAMREAGFSMSEESTGATTGESYYAEGPNLFCVRWTWVYWEAADE